MTKIIHVRPTLKKMPMLVKNQITRTASLSLGLLRKLYDWIMQWQEGDIYKWPYIKFPSRYKYRKRSPVLFASALNFQAHAIIFDVEKPNALNTPLQKTRRGKIRLSDYKYKKNVLLIFLPGVIGTIPKHLYDTLLIINDNFHIFEENDTEIILVVQSFSIEIRWLLNIKHRNGGLKALKFPIICDPWGLLINIYNSGDQLSPPEITTYTCCFIDKLSQIRYKASFDKQVKFNFVQIFNVIKELK